MDTTNQYSGLELERTGGLTSTGRAIRDSKTNKVSSMTGYEPQLKIAVDAFNDFKKNHDTFAAYKVIEYDTYSSSDIEKMNKTLSDKGVQFWRITMEIYQYKESSFGSPYTNTEDEPYYMIVCIYQTASGKYERFTYMTTRY